MSAATVETKDGIVLVSPDTLTIFIEKLETNFPGWWWSFSQKKNRLSLNLGPSRSGPIISDRELAKTKEGDNGYHYLSYHCLGYTTQDVLDWLDHVIKVLTPIRDEQNKIHGDDRILVNYRSQDHISLDYLSETYGVFLTKIPKLEEECIFKEIYLGSCDISVDCSLRGISSSVEEPEFDISVDFKGQDSNLNDSLKTAIDELEEDITSWRSAN